MSQTVLLEIGLEEMPAKYVRSSSIQLKEKMTAFLEDNRISFDAIEMYMNRLRVSNRTKKIGMMIEDVNYIRPFVVYGIGVQYELKRRKETSYGTNSKKI